MKNNIRTVVSVLIITLLLPLLTFSGAHTLPVVEETTEIITEEITTEEITTEETTTEETTTEETTTVKKATTTKVRETETVKYIPPKVLPREEEKKEDGKKPGNVNTGPTGGSSNALPPVSWNTNDGWKSIGKNRYYYKDKKPLTGMQYIKANNSDTPRYYMFNKYGVLTSKSGIDISFYQVNVDFKKIKESGIDFVMIRAGYRGYQSGKPFTDSEFSRHMEGAIMAGLDVGVYFYSQAVNANEAVQEADIVLSNIQEYRVTYPVVIDMEFAGSDDWARTDKLSTAQRVVVAKAFSNRIYDAGYYPMIYSNYDYLVNNLGIKSNEHNLTLRNGDKIDLWMANYTNEGVISKFPYNHTMWQFTSTGKVTGYNGSLDVNICYVDYPAIIQGKGLNKLK